MIKRALILLPLFFLTACPYLPTVTSRSEHYFNKSHSIPMDQITTTTFLNTYSQPYPFPLDGPLSITTAVTNDQNEMIVQIGLRAEMPKPDIVRYRNFGVVIDTSASMNTGQKLEWVKSGVERILQSLQSEDTFSIVTFDSSPHVLFPATHAVNKQDIRNKISTLLPFGGSNLGQGLHKGVQEVRKYASSKTISHLFLFTDQPIQKDSQSFRSFMPTIQQMLRDNNISISTYGLHDTFHDSFLYRLSNESQGGYYTIPHVKDMIEAIEEDFFARTYTAVDEIEVHIVLPPQSRLYSLYGHQYQTPRPYSYRIAVKPSMACQSLQTILMRISTPERSDRIANVSITYRDNRTNQMKSRLILVNRSDMLINDAHIHRNVLIATEAETLSECQRYYDHQQYSESIRLIDELIHKIESFLSNSHDKELQNDLGRLYRFRHKFEDAMEQYEHSLR